MGCPGSPLVIRPRGFAFSEMPSRRIHRADLTARFDNSAQVGDPVWHSEHFSKSAEVIHQLLLTVVSRNEFVGIKLGKSH
ncbi:MAG: hypothetical protein RL021_634 [Bacteroidota bacterium]